MKKYSGVFKNRFGQQMVEFLLVMPFVIILFGILTEYAYALTINMNLNQGLKVVTSSIYSKIGLDVNKDNIKGFVQSELKIYLRSRYAPANSDNQIHVDYRIVGDDAVFIASYKYIPAFTLPNIYFHFLPNSMEFLAISVVPKSFLNENAYDETLNPNLWGTPPDDTIARKGIMNLRGDSTDPITDSIVFLVPITIPILPGETYEIKKFNGGPYATSSIIAVANLSNNSLYICQPDLTSCSPQYFGGNSNFINYLSGIANIKNVFFYDDYSGSPNWIVPSTLQMTSSSVSGDLKNALALVNTLNQSIGNYDNLSPMAYNSSFDGWNNNKYIVDFYGSLAIVHTKNQSKGELGNLLSGVNIPYYSGTDLSGEFGTEYSP